jgi:hypothetical protein
MTAETLRRRAGVSPQGIDFIGRGDVAETRRRTRKPLISKRRRRRRHATLSRRDRARARMARAHARGSFRP